MKNSILFCITSLFTFTAFDKPNSLGSDYRDSSIGSYSCFRNCRELYSEHTSFSVKGDTLTIDVVKDKGDSVLLFTLEKKTFQFKLINKNLRAYPSNEHRGGYFFGTDSIIFNWGSLGPSGCTYIGKRK